jgi:hypothetical protein
MLPSIVRTIVPFLVALVGPWVAARLGVGADDLSNVLTVAIGGVYYFVVRLAEQWLPQFGWLLGVARAPQYEAAKAA